MEIAKKYLSTACVNLISNLLISYGITWEELTEKTNRRQVVYKRYLCWYILRKHKATVTGMGKAFLKDHSTVVHGIKQMTYMIENNDHHIGEIEKMLINTRDGTILPSACFKAKVSHYVYPGFFH